MVAIVEGFYCNPFMSYTIGAYSQTTRTEGCFTVNFACVDGSRCLTRENDRNGVCDALPDCSDGSDESRCGRGRYTREINSTTNA